MTVFQYHPAKPWHVGQIIRKMRKEQKEAYISAGISLHSELTFAFNNSINPLSAWKDGKLVALFGVMGSLLSRQGKIWLVMSDEAIASPISMMKDCWKYFTWAKERFPELVGHIPNNDRAAMKFAKAFGFKPVKISGQAREGFTWMRYSQEIEEEKRGRFIIFSLPRSRSKWLSKLFSHDGYVCYHDLSVTCDHMEDFLEKLSAPGVGTAETAMARAVWQIRERFPEIKIVVVMRPVGEVLASSQKIDFPITEEYLLEEEENLRKISQIPGVLTIDYEDLKDYFFCNLIYKHCLEKSLNYPRWEDLNQENIQIDMPKRIGMLRERWENIALFYSEVYDHISYQFEGMSIFLQDAKELLEMHRLETWEDLSVYDCNLSIYSEMEEAGNLRILTARKMGKIIGYFIFYLGPCLETPKYVVGYQNTAYIMKKFRGIGLTMWKIMKDRLRTDGVNHLILRAGVRGSGPKYKKLFQRDGAEYLGAMYKLKLGEK